MFLLLKKNWLSWWRNIMQVTQRKFNDLMYGLHAMGIVPSLTKLYFRKPFCDAWRHWNSSIKLFLLGVWSQQKLQRYFTKRKSVFYGHQNSSWKMACFVYASIAASFLLNKMFRLHYKGSSFERKTVIWIRFLEVTKTKLIKTLF